MDGWIKLHRKILGSPIFSDPDILRLWIYCLAKASFKETTVLIEKQEVHLLPGQFVTGRFALHAEFNSGVAPRKKIKETTLWNWLKRLETYGNLDIKSNNKFSVVSVVKWSEYQDTLTTEQQQIDNRLTTEQQQIDTNKNLKKLEKEKNVKKERLKDLCPDSPSANQDAPTDNFNNVKYGPDNTYYKMAIYFKAAVDKMAKEEGLSHLTDRTNIQTWADDFRKLVEINKQTDTRLIQSVMDWVVNNHFWRPNVLSAAKFREQFPKLVLAMNAESKPKQKTGTSGKTINPIASTPEAIEITDEEFERIMEETRKRQEAKVKGRPA